MRVSWRSARGRGNEAREPRPVGRGEIACARTLSNWKASRPPPGHCRLPRPRPHVRGMMHWSKLQRIQSVTQATTGTARMDAPVRPPEYRRIPTRVRPSETGITAMNRGDSRPQTPVSDDRSTSRTSESRCAASGRPPTHRSCLRTICAPSAVLPTISTGDAKRTSMRRSRMPTCGAMGWNVVHPDSSAATAMQQTTSALPTLAPLIRLIARTRWLSEVSWQRRRARADFPL
jgi:hypothetical protein